MITIPFRFLFFFLCLFCFGHSQNRAPYLELEQEADWSKISIDKLKAHYTFQFLLGDAHLEYSVQNNSNDSVEVHFIYPHQSNQNLYELSADINQKKYELSSKPITELRKEINTLSQRKKIVINTPPYIRLRIGKIPPHTSFNISLKYTQLLDDQSGYYEFNLPESFSKRSRSYTETQVYGDHLKEVPKQTSMTFEGFGNLSFQSVQINGKEITTSVKKVNFYQSHNSSSATSLRYSYQQEDISNGYAHAQIDGCDYILGSIQPPQKINPKTIAPREYIFVLDASGSMKGEPLEATKVLMKNVLQQLAPTEKFGIIFYSTKAIENSNQTLFATAENIEKALVFIDQTQSKGDLQLNDALLNISRYRHDPNFNRLVIVVSDGKMAIEEHIHLTIKQQTHFAQFFVLGIGHQIDYRAMNFLALSTGYPPLVISNFKELPHKMKQFETLILTPLLRNVRLQSTNINLQETYPKNFSSFLSSQALHFISKDCKKIYPKNIRVLGTNANQLYSETFRLDAPQQEGLSKALQFYWAKQRIDYLVKEEDRCGERCKKDGRYRQEIEKTGSTHAISTPYNLLIQNFEIAGSSKQELFSDYDSDGDQVMDWEDRCPYEAGDISSNGCPTHRLTTEEQAQSIEHKSNALLYYVEFNFDQATIRPQDEQKLSKIINLLTENPSLQFILEGHTDAFGTKEHNQHLSFQRAEAVKKYFIKQGIASERLSLRAKASTELRHPECRIATSCNDWKNFENRRVVMKLKKD